MNLKSNKVNKLIIALFVLGILATLFMLYQLPESVERISASISPEDIKDASPVFIKTSVVTIITLILGLISILGAQKNGDSAQVVEKVVYINENRAEEAKKTGEVTTDDKNIIEMIEQAIKNKRTVQLKYDTFLQQICNKLEAGQGILYKAKIEGKKRVMEMVSSYAFNLGESETLSYEFGEGLVGQAAKEKKSMKVDDIPEGYMTIVSGLGSASPKYLLIKPIVVNDDVIALIEIASFKSLGEAEDNFLEKAAKLLESDLIQKTEDKKQSKKPVKKSGKKENNEV